MKNWLLCFLLLGLAAAQEITPRSGGGAINPTTNCIPKKTGASAFGDSALCDNGTNITSTEPMIFPSLIFTDGAAPGAVGAGQHQPFSLTNLGIGQADISGTQTFIGAQLIDAQSGTTITIGAGDRAKLITSSNAAAVAASIAQAGSAGFPAGYFVDIYVSGAGTVTVTPATSTINGAATLAITTGCSAHIVSDGANYKASFISCGGGSGNQFTVKSETTNGFTPAASTTYWLGKAIGTATTNYADAAVTTPVTGTVVALACDSVTGGVSASATGATIKVCKGAAGATCSTGSISMRFDSRNTQNNVAGLTLAVTAGDLLAFQFVASAWATAPTSVYMQCVAAIQ